MPQTSSLPERQKLIPYVFVADAAFRLSPNIMKPDSGYRLSLAIRVVVNVFGIFTSASTK